MKHILKWPLIIAAAVVVLRIVVERAGAPHSVSNMLSIVALHTLLGPLYFAVWLGRTSQPRPYRTLFALIALYAVLTRAMVLPAYWLARIFQWPESRFAGLADASPFVGFVAIPFMTAGMWICASLVIGGAIGTATLAVVRSTMKRPSLATLPK